MGEKENWLIKRKKRQAFFAKMRRILGGSFIAAVVIGPLVYFSVCAIPLTAPGRQMGPPLHEAPATPEPEMRMEAKPELPTRPDRKAIKGEALRLQIKNEKIPETIKARMERPQLAQTDRIPELSETVAQQIPEEKLQTLQRVFSDRDAKIQSIKRPVDEDFEEILIVDKINIDFGPREIKDTNSAETVARNILQNYLQSVEGGENFVVLKDTSKIDQVEKTGQLVSLETKNHADKWYVTFRQYHYGLPVFDGNLRMIFTDSKKLIAITNNLKTDLPDPADFRAGTALVREKTKELFEWDEELDTIEYINQGYFKKKPAYRVDVDSHNPLGFWEIYVNGVDANIEEITTDIRLQDSNDFPEEEPAPADEPLPEEEPAPADEPLPEDEPEETEPPADDTSATPEPTIIEEAPLVTEEATQDPEIEITKEATQDPEIEILETFFSQVLAKTYPQTPDQEPQIAPMSDQYVYVLNNRLLTDEEGYFDNPARNWYDLLLDGPYVTVYDDDTENEAITNENPEEPFIWDEEVANLASINAFYHANKINRYFAHNHNFDLEKKIPLTVNSELVDAYLNGCGAWFNNTQKTIEMGRGATESCPEELNYALSSDLIYHEYTHFVVEEITHLPNIYGAEAAAMGEGLADYFATTINNDPLWGDVVAPNRTRNLDNDLNYKTDLTGNPHQDGQIFSGALWTLRQKIGAEETDRLVFNTLYQDRLHFETFMYGMIIEDDDNDDFSDGTPHLIEIIESFDKHGIGPGLENFEGLPITPEEWSEILEEEYPEGEEDELMGAFSGDCGRNPGGDGILVPSRGTCYVTGNETVPSAMVAEDGKLIIGDLNNAATLNVTGNVQVNGCSSSCTNGGELYTYKTKAGYTNISVAGTTTIYSGSIDGGYINLDGNVSSTKYSSFENVTVYGTGNFHNNSGNYNKIDGTLTLLNGSGNEALTVDSFTKLTINALNSGSSSNNGARINNNGEIDVSNTLSMYAGSQIDNNGTLILNGYTYMYDNGSIINNYGSLGLASGQELDIQAGTLTNYATAGDYMQLIGTVKVSGGTWDNQGVSYANTVNVTGGGTLTTNTTNSDFNIYIELTIAGTDSNFSHNNGITNIDGNVFIYGNGLLEIMNNGTFNITGYLGMQGSVSGPDTLYAYMTNYLDSASIDGGLLMLEYSITNNHGVLNIGNEAGKYLEMTQLVAGVAPTFTNHHSGTVNVYDSIIMGESASTSAKIINNGTFNVSDGGAINNSVQMYSNTSIENESTVAGSAYFDVESTSSSTNDGRVYIYDSAEITNTSSSSYYSYFDANRMFIGQEGLGVGGKFTNSNLGELSLTYSGTDPALNIYRGEFAHNANARNLTVAGKVEIKGIDIDHGLFTADQSGTIGGLVVREYATFELNGTPGNTSTLIATNSIGLIDEPSAENTILRVTEHGYLNATGSNIEMGTTSYNGGEIENDGEITADQVLVYPNSTITNNGLFTALDRLILISNNTAVFNNYGTFEGGALQVGIAGQAYGGLFNNNTGGTVNLAGHATYDSEIYVGEFVQKNYAGEVNIDGNMVISGTIDGGPPPRPGTFTHENMSGKVAIENLIIESIGIYDLSGDPVNNPGLEVKNLLSINGDSDYKGHLKINGSKAYILSGGEAEINAYGHLENKSLGDNTHGGFTSEGLVTVAAGGLLTSSYSPLSSVEFRRGLLTAGTVEIENDADATNNPTSGHAIEVTGGITTIGTPTNTGTTTSGNIYVSGGDFITYNDSSLTGDMTVIGSAASAYFEGDNASGCQTDILGDFSVLNNGTATINCENTGAVNVRSSSPGGVTTVEGTLIINTNLETEEMYVGDGATESGLVTHDEVDETWDPTTTFVLTVSDILHVRSNGAMDVSAKSTILDYPGEGNPRGGSYGGRGQYTGSTSDTVYGNIADPLIDFGRRGENGRESGKGGGIMHIDAFNFLIDSPGIVASNGEDAGENSGSGGSINIYTAKLSGSGNIQANGGAATRSDWAKTAGGGGRIYIEYYDMAGFTGDISAIGGQNTDGDQAGTGTIYYLWTDIWQNQNKGTLVIDAFLSGSAVDVNLDGANNKYDATKITSNLDVESVQLQQYGAVYLPAGTATPGCDYNFLTYQQCVESTGGQLYTDSSVCTMYNPEHDQLLTDQCISTPNPPQSLYINDSSSGAQSGQASNKNNLATIITPTPVVSGIHSDPDPNKAIQYQLQIATTLANLWNDTPDVCDLDEQSFDTAILDGNRSEDLTATCNLTAGTGASPHYYWRMRFKDDATGTDGWGLWSQSGQFDVDSGGIIYIDSCSSGTEALQITGLLNLEGDPPEPKYFDEEQCKIILETTDAIQVHAKKDQILTRFGGTETLPDIGASERYLDGQDSLGDPTAEVGFTLDELSTGIVAEFNNENSVDYDSYLQTPTAWHQLKTDLAGLGSHILSSVSAVPLGSFHFYFGAYVLETTVGGTYTDGGTGATLTLTSNP